MKSVGRSKQVKESNHQIINACRCTGRQDTGVGAHRGARPYNPGSHTDLSEFRLSPLCMRLFCTTFMVLPILESSLFLDSSIATHKQNFFSQNLPIIHIGFKRSLQYVSDFKSFDFFPTGTKIIHDKKNSYSTKC